MWETGANIDDNNKPSEENVPRNIHDADKSDEKKCLNIHGASKGFSTAKR